MKIALVAPMDPKTGISNYTETLAIELLKLGQKVDIVAPENSKNTQLTKMDGVNHTLPEDYKVSNHDVTHFQLANSPLHEFQLHLIQDHKKDLTLNSNIITTVHDARNFDVFNFKCSKCILFGLQLPESKLIYPYDVVDRGFQRISNLLLFHNTSAIDEYKTRYNLDQSIFRRVLHPAYRIPGIDSSWKLEGGSIKTLVAPGYISPYKGQDILIKAVKSLDMNFKLIFVGKILDDDYGRYLRNLVTENQLEKKVEFKGFVSEEEFIKTIDNAEAVLVPRLTSPWLKNKSVFKLRKLMGLNVLINQSTSGVLTKALASGKPVICSKNQGFADYINEDNGIMCTNTAESWAQAMKYILKTPNKTKEMSVKSRQFAEEELSPKKIAEEHLKFYGINLK
jgi:glycosyltransferase involved in cell wall biosynthesis